MNLSFYQFLESKSSQSSSKVSAIEDIAEALKKVFKDYSIDAKTKAWNKITTKRGDDMVKELIENPNKSVSNFRSLF